jgi:hypothetical protein
LRQRDAYIRRGRKAVGQWEYSKIGLNQLPRKTEDIDVLNDAGLDGWELVAILANNVAYLKRRVSHQATETMELSDGLEQARQNGHANDLRTREASVYDVKPKYRNP